MRTPFSMSLRKSKLDATRKRTNLHHRRASSWLCIDQTRQSVTEIVTRFDNYM